MTKARDIANKVKPGFLATISANTAVSTGVLPFDTVTADARCFNSGGYYNTSTRRFTAPTAGKYLFTVNCNVYNSTGVTFSPGIRVNGTAVLYGTRFSTNISGDNNGHFSSVINLAANDYVEAYVFLSSAMTLSGGIAWNSFSGMLVSD